jgi:hypothetical protein
MTLHIMNQFIITSLKLEEKKVKDYPQASSDYNIGIFQAFLETRDTLSWCITSFSYISDEELEFDELETAAWNLWL